MTNIIESFMKNTLQGKIYEGYNNDNNKGNTGNTGIIIGILNLLLLVYALYLSFKCNNGFNLASFLLACCCSPCYVAYRLAKPC